MPAVRLPPPLTDAGVACCLPVRVGPGALHGAACTDALLRSRRDRGADDVESRRDRVGDARRDPHVAPGAAVENVLLSQRFADSVDQPRFALTVMAALAALAVAL